MKKVILAMFIIAIGFASCKKDTNSSTEQTISISSLPSTVTNYVSNNYPDASIYKAVSLTHSDANYILTLNTEEEIAFDNAGSYLGDGANYHHPGHHGHHGHHGDGHNDGDADDVNNGIPIDSLSTSITGYVTTNYPGYTIKHAEKDSTCQYGSVTEVVINQSSTPHIKLYFDVTGTYLMSSSRLMYANLPVAVKDTITANYTTYVPRIVALKLSLANNSIEYNVFLNNGATHKRVTITDLGVVVCEQ